MAVQDPPKLGEYYLRRELLRDGLGILYEGVHVSQRTRSLVHILHNDITSNENFSVRWELLAPLLPKLDYPNLLRIHTLGEEKGIYYLVKACPFRIPDEGPLPTLSTFDYRQTPHRQRTLEQLFDGIALGLAALEESKDVYFKNGVLHDSLSPSRIYLSFQPTATGEGTRPVPHIDGFAESFLFFGDEPQAPLHHRLATPLYRWTDHKEPHNLYQEEPLHTTNVRRGELFQLPDLLYSFGSLIYQYVTHRPPKGLYPPLIETDPALDPLWDELIDYCLSAPHSKEPVKMRDVVERVRTLQSQHAQLTPEQKRLRDLEIPAGMTLVMLNDKVTLGAENDKEEEGPPFKARIKPFFMDITPVTCLQFKKFLKSFHPSSYSRDPDDPVTNVTWHMAKAYCRWRSEQEGLPEDTYRLPTEYEWEAAVRGENGDQYPWGPNPDPKRMHCNLGREVGTGSVKQHGPGRFGLYDMLGNVWEWTESTWGPHPIAKAWTIPYDPTQKVVKGGCWYTPLEKCRASARAAVVPNHRRGNLGFRCVRLVDLEVPKTEEETKEKEAAEKPAES